MAGTIITSSATVDTTGKIVTVTLSGGTAPYSLAGSLADGSNFAQIAPLTPSPLLGWTHHVTGVSITTGGVITITLGGSTIGQGETVTINLRPLYSATTPVITDSIGGSPSNIGQIPTATNNSTVPVRVVDFTSDTDKIETQFANTSAPASGGNNPGNVFAVAGASATDALVEFATDATEICIMAYSGYPTDVAVDGGASVALTTTTTGTSHTLKPISASPLATGKHLISLMCGAGASIGFVPGARIAGGTRSMDAIPRRKASLRAYTDTYAGAHWDLSGTKISLYGTYRTTGGTNPGLDRINSCGTSLGMDFGYTGSGVEFAATASWQFGIIDDGVQLQNSAVSGTAVGSYANANLAWPLIDGKDYGAHTISALALGFDQNSAAWAVYINNGTRLASAASIGASTISVADASTIAVGHWLRIGFGTNRERRRVESISGTTLTLNATLTKAHVIGNHVSSYSAPTAPALTVYKRQARTKRVLASGDSNTQGHNEYGFGGLFDPAMGFYPNNYDTRESAIGQACEQLGYELVNLGIQGTITAQFATAVASGAAGDFGHGAIDYYVIFPATNDVNNNSTTPAEMQANIQACITSVAPYLRDANSRIILMPSGTPSGTSAKGLSSNTVRLALDALAASNAQTISMGSLQAPILPSDINTPHYFQSGRRKMRDMLIPLLTGNYAPNMSFFGG